MRWLYKQFSQSLGRFLFGELDKLIANNEFERALRYANYLRPKRPKELGPVIYAAQS